MGELAPHLMKYDYIEPTLFSELALKQTSKAQVVNISPLVENIDVY